MNVKQFFRLIRRKTFSSTWDGALRCDDGRCPLGAANSDLVPVPSAYGASQLLGLRFATARKIAGAADSARSPNRRWLLKHLRVET